MSIARRRALVYVAMVISLVIAINLIKDILRLNQVDKRLEIAKSELEQAQAQQVELHRQLTATGDDQWQEQQIRNVLKMSLPGEKLVVVPEEITSVKELDLREINNQGKIKSNWQLWLEVFGYKPE